MHEGAEVVTGGKKLGDKGYFVEPTVLTNTKPDMKVVREEIFGPVVAAMPFDDLDDIAPSANDTIYGLAAGIWTQGHLARPTVWPACCAPARSGSTATTSSTPRCPSAATSSPAGAARWAKTS